MTDRSDRELLERAAKAAGYTCYRTDERGWFQVKDHPLYSTWELWNPLTDDGDALRLAVKLRMDLMLCGKTSDERGPAASVVFALGDDYDSLSEWVADHGGDENAATRRAIVRAAAAIGEQQ
jgi:hypothetical protein